MEHLKLICNIWRTFSNNSDSVLGKTEDESSVIDHDTLQKTRKDEKEQIYGGDRRKGRYSIHMFGVRAHGIILKVTPYHARIQLQSYNRFIRYRWGWKVNPRGYYSPYVCTAKRLLLGTAAPTTESTVAFYVYLSHSETKIAPHHTLLFDHIETNVGNSYNKHTGAFIAPMGAVYLFSYTVFCERHGYGSFEIVVNSASRGSIFVENGGSQSVYTGTTGFAVLLLNKGDACTIRTHSTYGSTGTIRSDELMRTTFSGVIIGHMM